MTSTMMQSALTGGGTHRQVLLLQEGLLLRLGPEVHAACVLLKVVIAAYGGLLHIHRCQG